ncbi:MAG: transcriptional regulator [Planctomycetes bacterium]|nr:transcriptional regulator [Planctomycetota bacterium]MBT5119333.1 transcriptional regulator [Planctomycetota bacterium]MBT7012052.1 transcriptional regulator [Planctomycetota bacterium]
MNLDPLIHAPARLAILSHLFVVESADATWLLAQTGLTWGNLSSHMTKLEEAKYIQVKKTFLDRKPTTILQMSTKGRRAFEAYREDMRQLIE